MVFDSVDQVSCSVGDIIREGIVPGAILIVELDVHQEQVLSEQAQSLCWANGAREVRRAETTLKRAELWKSRKRAFGAIGRISPNYLTQDGVVPRYRLPDIMN